MIMTPIEKAYKHVRELNEGNARWTMRIPVDIDRDSDCIIVEALRYAEQRIVELEARAEKAEANYQFMVDRAADEKLDSYRELGQRAADAENERDELRRRITELESQVPKVVSPQILPVLDRKCECGAALDYAVKYCNNCGSKVDWRKA